MTASRLAGPMGRMQPLIRPTFDPQPMAAADLDAAADHWLWLFDRSRHTEAGGVEHRTELRLFGFPRADADGIEHALRERLPAFAVERPDPDTLVVTGRRRLAEAAPPARLGVPRLAGPPFDGLYAEVRVRTTGPGSLRTPTVDSTLVLAGELTPTGFVRYAAWREGGSDLLNRAARGSPWPDEAEWRADLDRHRVGDDDESVSRPLAERLFPPIGSDRFVNRWVWLVSTPPFGSDRRAGTAARLAVNLLIAAVGVMTATLTPNVNLPVGLLKAFGLWLSLVPLYLFGKLFLTEWVQTKRFATASFARMYADPTRVTPVDPAVAAKVLDNPVGRKLTAEWEAAGGRHAGDAVVEPIYREGAVNRVYYAPDGVTYACLSVMTRVTAGDGTVTQHLWPAAVGPLLLTRFPNGGQAATMTDVGGSFRRKLSGPEFVGRIHPGVTDPNELLARHAALVREYTERTGLAPLPVRPFADFCRWEDEKMALERELYGPNPVTWADAFVALMGYTRQAYRA